MKSHFNIACVCVRALKKNRSGSLELSLSEESLFLLGAKETQGSFENIRCHNGFKQNQVVTELLCAIQRLAVFTLHLESNCSESYLHYSNLSFKTS